ncbi:MAG: class I SAM-dependent methyltransferase [Methylocella sp.]
MFQAEGVFKKLEWKKDRVVLGDLIFEIEDRGTGQTEAAERGFPFLKSKRMIDQYASFWELRKAFAARNILELGIHAGGSIVFWSEVFHPERLVALDIAPTGDSSLFQGYVVARGLQNRIKTYWETSQADPQILNRIVATDFSGPLDLVFDDASHLYKFSKISFETLFPLIRPGGLYIIEDWSWACWSGLPAHFNPSMTELQARMTREEMSLVKLICEIVTGAGRMEKFLSESEGFLSLKPLIANVHVYPDFAVIERGEAEFGASDKLDLELTLPRPQRERRLRSLLRRMVGRIARFLRVGIFL